MKIFSLTPLAASLALGTLAASSAHAQTAAAAAPANEVGKLDTVVVTANRRLEDQQKVSVSVTGLNGNMLEERNITNVGQLESTVPGFTFGRSGTDARPAMRGVRTENVAVNADTTIGYFVDGVYKSRAQQAMLGFVDVARVEVMRGPQGTLFGRNTFGGTVAVSTRAPELDFLGGNVAFIVGSDGKRRGEGVVNLPLNDVAAVRLVAAVEKSDPMVKNDFNGAAGLFDQDLRYLRGSVLVKPNRELEMTLRVDATEQRGNGGSAFGYKMAGSYLHTASCQQLFNATPLFLNTRGGNRDNVNDCTRTVGAGAGTGANATGTGVDLGVPLYRPGDTYRVDNDYQTFLNVSDRSASLDVSYKLPSVTLKSITGWADFSATRSSDTDFSASTIGIDYQATSAKTLSQELQLLSAGDGPLSYVVGAYFFKDELRGTFINQQLPRTIRSSALAAPLSLAQNGAGFYDDQAPETRSTAFYGQFSYRLQPDVTLTAGARSTRDRKSFRFANANSVLPLNANGQPDGTLITLNTPLPPESAYGSAGSTNCTGSNAVKGFNCAPGTNLLYGATYDDATFSRNTGRLALDYQLSSQQLLYASLSTGFRSGGFNSGQALEAVRTFKPETVRALEIGSKNRFLANTLQLNVALFSNEYKDLQEQRQVPVGNTTVSTIFNAAQARARGLEAELEWKASRDFSLGATLSLLDAKYKSFPGVALPFGTSILVADPASTAPQLDASGIVIAPAGQRRIFAPGYDCGVLPGTGGAGQPAVAFGCNLSGKRIPYAAKVQATGFLRYEFALADGASLTPMLVATYNSGFYGQPTNAELERQGAFTKLDFKLSWRINDRLSLQGYVDNFTDKQTINRFVWGGGGALQVSTAPPRQFGLRLSYGTL
ncbi:TonB-dependent receptor [Roseateles toxinivorans]|uniref:Outer membrane receptor protein involved in Fe transport n=1 Tax=Roseateles toxinivorans TaxID=270368 RepID=A0A4R6QFX1_9BURK|nr:TonB-dependent receptor [Roseateles toxinivorans]TDP61290.1 outer membrane receptor protein involved in Fe transport [Roseateles toxinivorans]